MTCSYCTNQALMFCRSHGKHICAELDCIRLHRYGKGGKPVCNLYAPDVKRDWWHRLSNSDRFDWIDIALVATGLLFVTLFSAIVAVHRGGQ